MDKNFIHDQIDMFPELFLDELVKLTEELALYHDHPHIDLCLECAEPRFDDCPEEGCRSKGVKCRHGHAPSYSCPKCIGEVEYELGN